MPSLRLELRILLIKKWHGTDYPSFRTVMVERVAYKEMFLTGSPPAPSETGGAGAEIAALATEMEAIVKEAQGKTQPRVAVG